MCIQVTNNKLKYPKIQLNEKYTAKYLVLYYIIINFAFVNVFNIV